MELGLTLLTGDEIKQGAGVIPSRFQVSDNVLYWIVKENGKSISLPATVVGIHIGLRHEIRYDLAFQIGTTDEYSVVRGLRGWITSVAETVPPEDDGLIPVSVLLSELKRLEFVPVESKTSHLTLVKKEPQ